jgi:hypothetical protein
MQTASSHVGSSTMMDCLNIGARVESLHVSSTILVQKSVFFYELLSNGMRESKKQNITLRISSLEEMTFMDLLQYMYSVKIRAQSFWKC